MPTIQPYDPAGRAQVLCLYRDVFSREPWCDKEPYEQTEAYFRALESMNTFIGYCLYDDANELCGVSLGFLKPYIEGMEYYIDQFCVTYAKQGKGLGSAFVELIRQDLKPKNVCAIMLQTEVTAPAFRFYQKQGFWCNEEERTLYKDV